MAVEQALAQFKETEGGESFRLQNSKLLKVGLAGEEDPDQARLDGRLPGRRALRDAGSADVADVKKAVTNEDIQR